MIANEHKITNDPGKLAYQAHPTTIIYQPIVCVGRLASNMETIKKDQQVHLELFGTNSWIYLIREGLKNPLFPLRNLLKSTDPPPVDTFREKSSHFLVSRI